MDSKYYFLLQKSIYTSGFHLVSSVFLKQHKWLLPKCPQPEGGYYFIHPFMISDDNLMDKTDIKCENLNFVTEPDEHFLCRTEWWEESLFVRHMIDVNRRPPEPCGWLSRSELWFQRLRVVTQKMKKEQMPYWGNLTKMPGMDQCH